MINLFEYHKGDIYISTATEHIFPPALYLYLVDEVVIVLHKRVFPNNLLVFFSSQVACTYYIFFIYYCRSLMLSITTFGIYTGWVRNWLIHQIIELGNLYPLSLFHQRNVNDPTSSLNRCNVTLYNTWISNTGKM